MNLSVAMAYYNGEKYIDEQLESIIRQLGPKDEIIISVDGAKDGSFEKLGQWVLRDSRICVIDGPKKGVTENFANAIRHCKNEIIFLSDQDDIWKPDKVKKVLGAFKRSGAMAVLHNAAQVDGQGQAKGEPDLFAVRKSNTGIIKNLIMNSYVGCCMAFKKELVPVILPIPERMYMHDYWIGTAAELMGGVALLKEPLILYRRHGENVTQMHHGSFRFMLKKRLDILVCFRDLRRRIKKIRKEGPSCEA